jgi:hypothetical protein
MTTTAMTLQDQLSSINACAEAIQWVGERDLQTAWNECPRGDWMLWLYVRSKNVDQRKLHLAKGYCARTVEHLMKDDRSKKAVQAAIDFGNGEIDSEQLRAAADAADAAYAAADAAAAARIKNRQETADICREYLPIPDFS